LGVFWWKIKKPWKTLWSLSRTTPKVLESWLFYHRLLVHFDSWGFQSSQSYAGFYHGWERSRENQGTEPISFPVCQEPCLESESAKRSSGFSTSREASAKLLVPRYLILKARFSHPNHWMMLSLKSWKTCLICTGNCSCFYWRQGNPS
jgi:hypothetical protein